MSTGTSTGVARSPGTKTQWSLVDRAAAGDIEAQGTLAERYRHVLVAHLRYKFSTPPDQAEELVQDFLVDKVLVGNCIAQADRTLGKFRTFLRTTLENYARDRLRKKCAKKRRPEEGQLSLDDPEVHAVAAEALNDEADLEWARAVIAAVLDRVKAHYERKGKRSYWEVFEARLVAPYLGGDQPLPFDELIRRFEFRSPQQAFNVLMDGKRQFRKHLEAVVAEYAEDERMRDAEIQELKNLLRRFGAR